MPPEKRGRFLEARHESLRSDCGFLCSIAFWDCLSFCITSHPSHHSYKFSQAVDRVSFNTAPLNKSDNSFSDWNKNDFLFQHVVQNNQIKSPWHFTSCLPHTSKVINLNTKAITNHQFLLVNQNSTWNHLIYHY